LLDKLLSGQLARYPELARSWGEDLSAFEPAHHAKLFARLGMPDRLQARAISMLAPGLARVQDEQGEHPWADRLSDLVLGLPEERRFIAYQGIGPALDAYSDTQRNAFADDVLAFTDPELQTTAFCGIIKRGLGLFERERCEALTGLGMVLADIYPALTLRALAGVFGDLSTDTQQDLLAKTATLARHDQLRVIRELGPQARHIEADARKTLMGTFWASPQTAMKQECIQQWCRSWAALDAQAREPFLGALANPDDPSHLVVVRALARELGALSGLEQQQVINAAWAAQGNDKIEALGDLAYGLEHMPGYITSAPPVPAT